MERKYARNAQAYEKRKIPPLAYQGSNAGINKFWVEKKEKNETNDTKEK